MRKAPRKLSQSPPRTEGFLSKGKLDFINLACLTVPLTAESVGKLKSSVLPVERPHSCIKCRFDSASEAAHVHGDRVQTLPFENSKYLGISAKASLTARMVKALPIMWETWV